MKRMTTVVWTTLLLFGSLAVSACDNPRAEAVAASEAAKKVEVAPISDRYSGNGGAPR